MERSSLSVRVGVAAGAGIAAVLILLDLRGASSIDAFELFAIALALLVGGYVGGEAALAFAHVRRSPIVLAKALAFLIAISALLLAPTMADDFRARSFLASADSAQGVITGVHYRGGKQLQLAYVTGDSTTVLTDLAWPSTAESQVGDTVWAFWDGEVPTRATIGRPSADWASSLRVLLPVWILGGVLFLAYHGSAAAVGVPKSWQRPLHLARAYLGASAAADIGLALMISFMSDLTNPQLRLARVFDFAVFVGAFFSLIYTAILGILALGVLVQCRRTSVLAFAGCGLMFGAFGGLTIGLDGLAVGSIAGLFAGVTFRWLLFRTSEPLLFPKPAA